MLQYLEELYLVTLPQVMGFALLAMFVQTMVSNKFIGHGLVIGAFVIQPILFNFGWENTLYLPGTVPAYTYSDMNGYGHFVQSIGWAIGYWFSIFAFLGVVSIAYAERDMLVWDNWRLLHARNAFSDRSRHLRRIQIAA